MVGAGFPCAGVGKMKKYRFDPLWQAQVDAVRTGVMQTLRAIQAGQVDELELEKLHNFCATALALMQIEGAKSWALAKINAEVMWINAAIITNTEEKNND